MKFIYLVLSGNSGYYKIGVSKHPIKRLKELQTADPSYTIISTFKSNFANQVEKTLHRQFIHKNVGGELFDLSYDDVNKFHSYCAKIDFNLNYIKDNSTLTGDI